MGGTRRRRESAAVIVLLAIAVSLLTADGVPGQTISSGQARVVCAVSPALVRVATTLAYQPGGGMTATGVIIDRYGHVLTNNHVIVGAGSISLTEGAPLGTIRYDGISG